MNELNKSLWEWRQPQLISLIVTVLIVFVISLLVYFKVKKTKANEASKGIVQIAEAYVGSVEKTFEAVAGPEKLKITRFYILTLGTFLLVGNAVAMFGLEPIATSYSIPFTLALLTWMGVMVIGSIYGKWKFYRNLLLPTELVGKFSIIVSLSFRIYGNIIGGSSILAIAYITGGILWQKIFSVAPGNEWHFLAIILTPFLHFYFDIFGSTLQAFIFALLTSVYWVSEVSEAPSKKTNSNKKVLFKNWSRKKVEAIY
ncbi:F0F1 ATP synthase subunit A [Mycoplasmopsis canis UFG4]|uniref:F0F1 ATP synthase subunit A n=2 Tax=Mycoplasmopsis canis TaxID=29555 RepID=I1A6T0_9BACT|nr:F0F1 ATP synthase subunit A [Mycoplasmopsis canis]AKF41164.1 ATP synthase F0F1 subunit A [Mycoplasmopsis canis]AMD81278.1 ATP synthase F0F1 subunit A [Mycoplasmopsis canis PG 14]EIE40441.1 F0F1 ATP synthase subunit A [Mycoplasmopsis canis UF31]EIE40581.1 F0F1 ATP synthase subunit A [Mycoplasmopsis canis PG 14]EIE40725.1 F0F1 ATP synthase subunit A [Mycoplasmopsis canis UF33]